MDRIITTTGTSITNGSVRQLDMAAARFDALDIAGWPGLPIDGDAPARLAYVDTTMDLPVSDMLSNVSPDCRDGNHGKCFGTAWDLSIDEATACDCECGCSAEWAGEL